MWEVLRRNEMKMGMSSLFNGNNVNKISRLVTMEIVLQSTLVAQRSKPSVSTRTITEGYLEQEMLESGLEGSPGIQQVEKWGNGHPSQREMWLSSERMQFLSGKWTVQSRPCDCQAILFQGQVCWLWAWAEERQVSMVLQPHSAAVMQSWDKTAEKWDNRCKVHFQDSIHCTCYYDCR